MLPRSRILRGREPIQLLFRKGHSLKERNIDLRFLFFPEQPGMCLMGFIAGKRLGKANKRNAIKRRMREAYRLHQHLIRDFTKSEQIGFQGILIAKRIDTPFADMEQECIRLLTSARDYLKTGKTP